METRLIIILSCAAVFQTSLSITTVTTDTPTICGNLTCSHNSKCRNDSSGIYHCQCHAGFQGTTCHDDTDECRRGNPCYHRGHCHNTIGSWWCECLDGWNGTEHCEENLTDVRRCLPGWQGEWCENQCTSDSDCGPTTYCKKKASKDEYYCAHDRDECAYNPCKHSGSCINTIGSYMCACENGWTGTDCDADVNECTSTPCENMGQCTNNNGSFTCKCKSGWIGQTCSEVDNCSPSPCKNLGTCNNTPGSYKCTCQTNWAGPTCEDRDICLIEKPCSNSANCTITNHTYHCQCADGWQGVNCTNDVNECAIKKCMHAYSCSNSIGSYTCNCTLGWQGDDCNDDVNECDSNPCNGTTLVCKNTQGSYECVQRSKGNSSTSNVGIIAGVSAGAFLAIVAAVLALLYKFKWKRNPRNSVANLKEETEVGNKHFQPQKNGITT